MNIAQKEFFSRLDLAISVNADAMLSIDHEDLHVAVWLLAVVGKADFVALARGIDNIVFIQIEKKAAVKLCVDHFSTGSLCFCDFFAAIFLQRTGNKNP